MLRQRYLYFFPDVPLRYCICHENVLTGEGRRLENSSSFILIADVPSEQSVFVMLNGEESELRFLNITNLKVRDRLNCEIETYYLYL